MDCQSTSRDLHEKDASQFVWACGTLAIAGQYRPTENNTLWAFDSFLYIYTKKSNLGISPPYGIASSFCLPFQSQNCAFFLTCVTSITTLLSNLLSFHLKKKKKVLTNCLIDPSMHNQVNFIVEIIIHYIYIFWGVVGFFDYLCLLLVIGLYFALAARCSNFQRQTIE